MAQIGKEKEIKEEIIIDAADSVLGRLASFAAKQALLGKKIVVVNSEKALITGNKQSIIKDYKHKLAIGRAGAFKGPFFPRTEERIMRRTIRGMLPWKRTRGRSAYRNVRCYIGIPLEYESAKKINFKKDLKSDYVTLKELCELL
jgi:large subunit ribosomal protein L13